MTITTPQITAAPVEETEFDRPELRYTGIVDFAEIDRQILWAESESLLGEASQWEQSEWSTAQPEAPCGTAFCIAGHVAFEMGAQPAEIEDEHDWSLVRFLGETTPVSVLAAERLGIVHHEMSIGVLLFGKRSLFDGANTIEDLKQVRDRMAMMEGYPTKYSL